MAWVFGYGSLIWRPGFSPVTSFAGTVRGWRRVFWQGSPDHRGTPEAPGRVVTLVPDAETSVVGVAYQVAAADEERVLGALDHREQGGYARHDLEVRALAGDRVETAVVYVATEGNESWLGPASAAEIAAVARERVGPSGPNREYVEKLDAALRGLGVEDAHVSEIARLL